jgi:hypothetical protein
VNLSIFYPQASLFLQKSILAGAWLQKSRNALKMGDQAKKKSVDGGPF